MELWQFLQTDESLQTFCELTIVEQTVIIDPRSTILAPDSQRDELTSPSGCSPEPKTLENSPAVQTRPFVSSEIVDTWLKQVETQFELDTVLDLSELVWWSLREVYPYQSDQLLRSLTPYQSDQLQNLRTVTVYDGDDKPYAKTNNSKEHKKLNMAWSKTGHYTNWLTLKMSNWHLRSPKKPFKSCEIPKIPQSTHNLAGKFKIER